MQHVETELHAGPNFVTRPDPTRKNLNVTRPANFIFFRPDPTRPASRAVTLPIRETRRNLQG